MFTPENIFETQPLSESIIMVDPVQIHESLGYKESTHSESGNKFIEQWNKASKDMFLDCEIPKGIKVIPIEKDGKVYISLTISPSLTIIVSNEVKRDYIFPKISTEISHIIYGNEDIKIDILSILMSDNPNKPLLTFYGTGQYYQDQKRAVTPLLSENNREENFVCRVLHELGHDSLYQRHYSYAGITELTPAQREREVNAHVLQAIRQAYRKTKDFPLDAPTYDQWTQKQLGNYDSPNNPDKDYQASRKARKSRT